MQGMQERQGQPREGEDNERRKPRGLHHAKQEGDADIQRRNEPGGGVGADCAAAFFLRYAGCGEFGGLGRGGVRGGELIYISDV